MSKFCGHMLEVGYETPMIIEKNKSQVKFMLNNFFLKTNNFLFIYVPIEI